MKDFSVGMALVDFLPVIFFAAGAVLLMRDLYNKMSKGAFALFAAGAIDITCAGMLKACYKLLYAAGVCDFEALNTLFFPMQSIGFLLAGVGMLALLCHKQAGRGGAAYAVAPPLFSGTFVFVALMVAGLGLMDAGLCILAAKMKQKKWMVLFILSFACSLGMGYLSSQDFTEASMNWIAQGVNLVGQGLFLLGAWVLHQHKLADFHLQQEKHGSRTAA